MLLRRFLLPAAVASCLLAVTEVAGDDDIICKPLDNQGKDAKDSYGRTYDLSPLRKKSGEKYV